MKLKKLELHGFKSFADKTEVFFDQGVTCVVGPNGCGKSNISDSIRWVLGERSAKMLRGSKMEDVIFNGTDFRKPLSYAEVSLTFDNEDRGLPIDYNEVTITRRLYRSGESEYLINKTLVRLKDIHDLILDTGIGSNSYSMIEQGRIDYILNADPEKRRFLIEEAAGISKYKVKKDEAIRKLERTEANLLRLNDIIQEVHKNIQYAERQARRAERYREKYEELKKLEITKAFHDLHVLKQEKEGLGGRRAEEQSELDHVIAQKKALQEVLSEQEAKREDAQQRFSQEEAGRFRFVSQKEKNEQQLRFHQEKRMEFATRKGEIQQEQHQLHEHLERNARELVAKKEELLRLEDEVQKIEGSLSGAEGELKEAEDRLNSVKSMLEKSKMEAFEIAAEMTRLKNEYHRMLAFLESSDKQKNKMDGNLERFKTEREDWEARKRAYEESLRDLSEKHQSLENDDIREREYAEDLTRRMEEEEQALQAAERLLPEKKTRLEMLQEIDAASSVNLSTIQQDLPALGERLVFGLRDVIRVREGYEWALEAALGEYVQAVIARDTDAAELLIQYLLERKTGEASVLLAGQAGFGHVSEVPVHPLIEGSLRDAVEIQPEFQAVLDPLLREVLVARLPGSGEWTQLLELAETRKIVLCEGICVGPGKKIYIRQGTREEQSVFGRTNEISHLETEIRTVEAEIESRRRSRNSLKEEVNQSEVRLEGIRSRMVECKIQQESIESHMKGIQDRLVSHHREAQLVMEDILELQNQRTEVESRKERLETELAGLEAREKEHRDYESRMLREIEEKDQAKNQVLRNVAEQRARFDNISEQRRILKESTSYLEAGTEKDRKRIESLKEESERILVREKELEETDVKIHEDQRQLDESIRQCDLALEMIRQEKAKAEEDITSSQTRIDELARRQNELQENLHQWEMKAMDIQYQERAVAERLDQTYQIRLHEFNAADYPWEESDGVAVEQNLEGLREKVKSMGAVNLLAIEEYDEMKKRYDFLMSQKEDLENSRIALLDAIKKINRTTRSLFEETFNNVQAAFKDYYQTLFRGGEARLILEDETKPLESGIDIVVRPPGKRLQHISLLSGGEKALTAIALLFALFKIKPSPYCVLDEVDAPLDEANIDRFLTVLRTFLTTSQFIIITHNRKTIAMGDSLYGVTMQEAGVSKIVSVRVGEDKGGKLNETDSGKAKENEAVEEDSVIA